MLSSTTGLACPRTTRREWHGPPSMFVNYLTIPNRLARLGLAYMIRAYLADQPRLLADQIPHFCDANHIPRLKQRL